MAFASVAASNSGNSGANATAHTVTLPTGIVSGDVVLVFFSNDGTATASVTTPASGWVQVGAITANSAAGAARLTILGRYCDGAEGATITVTTTASEGSAYATYRITGHRITGNSDLTGQIGIELTLHNTTGSSVNPNPPSETASWGGAEDNLWIMGYAWDGNVSHTSYPANYTANQLTNRWANTGGSGIAVATRDLAADTEDPGTAVISASDQWASFTMVIRHAVHGGGGPPPFSGWWGDAGGW